MFLELYCFVIVEETGRLGCFAPVEIRPRQKLTHNVKLERTLFTVVNKCPWVVPYTPVENVTTEMHFDSFNCQSRVSFGSRFSHPSEMIFFAPHLHSPKQSCFPSLVSLSLVYQFLFCMTESQDEMRLSYCLFTSVTWFRINTECKL